MPSSVPNVATPEPLRAWRGLESHRASRRARWRASEVAEVVGGVDVGDPVAALPAFDPAVDDPQDGTFGIGVLLAMRRFGSAVHDGDAGQTGPRQQRVEIGRVRHSGVIDHDQQVAECLRIVGAERRTVVQRGCQLRSQFCDVIGEVACRADTVDLTRNVTVRQPLEPRPVIAFEIGRCEGDTEHGRVVPCDGLRDPCAQRAPHLVGLPEHGDPGDLGQVDAGRRRADGALHVEQTAQGAERHRLEVDLVGAVLHAQRGVQWRIVQTCSDDQEVGVVRVALPLPARTWHVAERGRIGMRPLERRGLLGRVPAHVVADHGQVAQVVGALGVDLLGPHLVVATAVERGGGQEQDEGEEQRRRRDQPHAGRNQRHDHAHDEDHDQVWQHASQQ